MRVSGMGVYPESSCTVNALCLLNNCKSIIKWEKMSKEKDSFFNLKKIFLACGLNYRK